MIKWFDVADTRHKWRQHNIYTGGRGIGKTYSLCRYVVENKINFLYLRNTVVQLQISCSEKGNPFKRFNRDTGNDVHFVSGDHLIDVKNGDEFCGYAASLSTFKNLRGVDLSDIDLIFFDEFIERGKLQYDQFDAYMNAVETIGRNRELLGETPLQILLLSNAQSIESPILAGLDLINDIEKMIANEQYTMSRDNIYVNLCKNEVSDLKAKTAQYKALAGSKYFDEAIKNKFANNNFYGIKKVAITEYKPLYAIDELVCYRHKSESKYHICGVYSNTVPYFTHDQLLQWRRIWWQMMLDAYTRGAVTFDSYSRKMQFESIICRR